MFVPQAFPSGHAEPGLGWDVACCAQCVPYLIVDIGAGDERLGHLSAFLSGRSSTQVCAADTRSFGYRQTDLG